MFTLAIEGGTYKTYSVRIVLTLTTDPYHGFHRKASTGLKDEVGHRGGEEYEEIHSGAFWESPPSYLDLTPCTREKN